MRKHVRFSVCIVIIIMLSLVGGNLTLAQQSGNSDSPDDATSQYGKLPWHSQYAQKVNFPQDVGTYTSLAINPLNDLPYISYYDAYNGDLMLAHFLPNGGGNCGTNNNWKCEVLDGDVSHGGANVGTHTSIDIIANEADHSWRIGISYHDVTNDALKFISWTCGTLVCTIHNIVTIASPASAFFNYGLYTSVRLRSDGTAYIVYQNTNLLTNTDTLRYASYVGSGGNCGVDTAAGKW
jgi:hypothetical protein